MSTQILKGLRVLDLTRMLSGPYCTMHLADHGAGRPQLDGQHEPFVIGDFERSISFNGQFRHSTILPRRRNMHTSASNYLDWTRRPLEEERRLIGIHARLRYGHHIANAQA